MLLKELIKDLDVLEVKGNTDIEICNIAYDSRKTVKGGLFVCICGFKMDGHEFIHAAINNKVAAIIVQKDVHDVPEDITVVRVICARAALAQTSNVFFGRPSTKLNIIGVTGTKGKTTTTYMLKSILESNARQVGIIGTIANIIGTKELVSTRTTPESSDLQEIFAEAAEEKVNNIVMEVSSHALELARVNCVDYDIGIFTNLSQDHLDFHKSMEEYLAAKMKLFNLCKKGLINIDSEYGKIVYQTAPCEVFSFGIDNDADFRATDISLNRNDIEFTLVSKLARGRLKANVPGKFSVYNALAVASAACLVGIPFSAIKEGLLNVKVAGRAEVVETRTPYTVIVDYAHSPDSLKNILETIKGYATGKIICVFGCGGDRDRAKRPIMGEISGQIADITVITSDNPRTEEPETIMRDIEEGVQRAQAQYDFIVDRKEAIAYALKKAEPEDVVLIAGKGHETYQIFKDKICHFSDKEVVQEILEAEYCNSL